MLKVYHHQDGSQHHAHLQGWRKQHHDPRDEAFRLKIHPGILGASAPPSADLRLLCSPIEDQGNLGSCTANMLAGLVESNEIRTAQTGLAGIVVSPTGTPPAVTVSGVTVAIDGSVSFTTKVGAAAPTPTPTPTPTPAPHTFIDVSRLFQYYATRTIENSVSTDSGATIRDTLKAANQYGVLDEKLWPYDISKFAVKPGSTLWTNALSHKVTSYHSIADGDLTTMKAMIASGYLVGFGFNVYSYFMSQDMATHGVLHLPTKTETLEGGHAVALCGYDDAKGAFLVRNSWGTSWGLAGYFYMDYAYVAKTTLCSDFWVVQSSPV